MIAAMIIIFLYVLIGCWLIALAHRNAIAISEFRLGHWLAGSSHSVEVFKGVLFVILIVSSFALVGYIEAYTP